MSDHLFFKLFSGVWTHFAVTNLQYFRCFEVNKEGGGGEILTFLIKIYFNARTGG